MQVTTLPKISSKFMPPKPPSNINIISLIKRLPDNIKYKIYKEYFEPEVYYILYKRVVEKKLSQSLHIDFLLPLIPILLSKKTVIEYICSKCKYFKIVYDIHKIQNKNNYAKLLKGESFALSILMYLYH